MRLVSVSRHAGDSHESTLSPSGICIVSPNSNKYKFDILLSALLAVTSKKSRWVS